MAVTLTVKAAGPGAVLAEWSSTLEDPTYYMYRDGIYLGSTKRTFAYLPVRSGELFEFEVLDSSSEQPESDLPGIMVLTWEPGENVSYYRVDQWVDSAWSVVAKVYETGLGIYKYVTGYLADETVHVFRIVPVGTNGSDGTAKDFSARMVRKPDKPDVGYALNPATGVVTVT